MTWEKTYQTWHGFEELEPKLKLQLQEMTQEEIEDAFSNPLSFGTAGMRGLLGPGINRMNIYTVRQATEGLAQFILQSDAEARDRGVVIAYDSRHMSSEFAMEAALVLGKHKIKTYVYESLRPTPVLSFAVRYLKAFAGIMITASHNPAAYNGYKLYGADGGQLPPDDANMITTFIRKVSNPLEVTIGDKTDLLDSGIVEIIGDRVDEAYLNEMQSVTINPGLLESMGSKINIVFTPLHGTGYYLGLKALNQAGFQEVHVVESQAIADGDFPTVGSPNPEAIEAFALAEELGLKVEADIILATDPDADRLGAMIKGDNGQYQLLTGNQIACLMLDYILKAHQEKDALPENGVAIKSIVSTNLANRIVESYGLEMVEVLTGFKFIAEKIHEYEQTHAHTFLFGFEESYGYLCQPFVRDKDAIQALVLLSELTAYHKEKNKSLWQALEEIFQEHGHHYEKTLSVSYPGPKGQKKMQEIMAQIQENPPKHYANILVRQVEDYQRGIIIKDNNTELPTNLPQSQAVKFVLADNSWVAFRPSGTEPKIKMYIGTVGENYQQAQEKASQIEQDLKRFAQ